MLICDLPVRALASVRDVAKPFLAEKKERRNNLKNEINDEHNDNDPIITMITTITIIITMI